VLASAAGSSYASTWFILAGFLSCLADYKNPLLLPPNAVHASTLLGLLVRLAELSSLSSCPCLGV